MILQGVQQKPVTEAILHCTAVKTGFWNKKDMNTAYAVIDAWHKARGWAGIGYHIGVMPDGQWFLGRPFTRAGAHTIGHNLGTIGVVMLESYEVNKIGHFENFFTDAQRHAVKNILSKIPGLIKVSGHNDYAAKLCPGFKVRTSDWLGHINNGTKNHGQENARIAQG